MKLLFACLLVACSSNGSKAPANVQTGDDCDRYMAKVGPVLDEMMKRPPAPTSGDSMALDACRKLVAHGEKPAGMDCVAGAKTNDEVLRCIAPAFRDAK